MRLVVQSRTTGRFLAPCEVHGTVEWVRGLREAGGGVVFDMDAAIQLLEDHAEPHDRAVIVDLDRLGTADDYSDSDGSAGARSASASGARSAERPDGNHGETFR